jgi:TrpR-related protein YerC/YecD
MSKKPDRQKLMEAILQLNDVEEAKEFLDDLLSPAEWRDLANRFEVAGMLRAGKSYVQIEHDTGTSSTTISRISRCLKRPGSGYEMILTRLES